MTRIAALAAGLGALVVAGACNTSASEPPRDVTNTTPVYNKTDGKLELLTSDRDKDGKTDTWAHMDGTSVKWIEIDRHGHGQPDRWEYYVATSGDGRGGPSRVIDHADEANGPNPKLVTRREYFLKGQLEHTEEDTDFDGKVDKWEYYDHNVVTRVEFDLEKSGRPDRRLVYGPDGSVLRIEVPDQDGRFTSDPAAATPARKGRGQ